MTQHMCSKLLTCAANQSQILAADQAGLDLLGSTLTNCHSDNKAKCKIDKALEREGLEKSTASTEPTKVRIFMCYFSQMYIFVTKLARYRALQLIILYRRCGV